MGQKVNESSSSTHTPNAQGLRLPRRLIELLLLVMLAPMLAFILKGVPFANDGHCDPWYTFGLFYIEPQATHWLPLARQVGRLAEIAPGYALTHMLPGISADYALFYIYYTASVASVYYLTWLLISPRLAIVGAAVFATSPIVLADYSITLDTPALLYNCLSFLAIAAATRSVRLGQHLLLLFVSGAALGFAVNAHLAILPFACANYVTYLIYMLLERRRRLIFLSVVSAAIGALTSTAALGVANVLFFGGAFMQVLNQLAWVGEVSKHNADLYWDSTWFLKTPDAALLCLMLVITTISMFRLRAAKVVTGEALSRVTALSGGVFSLICALLLYDRVGGVFLQYDYYFEFLIPYLALTVVLPLQLFSFDDLRWTLPCSLTFLFVCVAAASVPVQGAPWLYQEPQSMYLALLLTLIIALLILLSRRFEAASILSPAFYLGALAGLTLIVRPNYFGQQLWTADSGPIDRDSYARIRQGLTFLSSMHFAKHPKFWVDTSDGRAETIAFPRSYLQCQFNPFPRVDPRWWFSEDRPTFGIPVTIGEHRFLPGDNVVVVSAQHNIASVARKSFDTLGLLTMPRAHLVVGDGNSRYEILVEYVLRQVHPPRLDDL